MHRPAQVLESQAHILNFKRHKIMYEEGIRTLILRRNSFTDGFAHSISHALFSDKYLKKIDVSGNYLSAHALSIIVKLGLMENQSLMCFDARINPGFTEKIQR